jgi:PAP2 superfamily protein
MVRTLIVLGILCVTLTGYVNKSPAALALRSGQQLEDPSDRPVNPVIQWNAILLGIVRTSGAQPAAIHATRSFAMMHAAIYDAVNSIEGTHRPYLVRISGTSQKSSQEAAAIVAAYEVLFQLYPQFQPMLNAELQTALGQIPGGASKTSGMEIGQMVADNILGVRASDGSAAAATPFVSGTNPGDYQPTPPNFPKPAFTNWSFVNPFALESASQFRSGPPPALTSDAYAQALNQVKELGQNTSSIRSADQTIIGRFWGGAIQNYWNEIAQTAAVARKLDIAESARLFALLNLTLADTVIAFYDTKYTYRFWRPVAAIRAADQDGNPQTDPDPNWLPLPINTAPDPSYPGAHGAISSAGATVLDSFFRKDHFKFQVTSEVMPGILRSFTSFSAAADEATMSRIYAGQHFIFDQTAGARLGRKVARFVVKNFLTPAG